MTAVATFGLAAAGVQPVELLHDLIALPDNEFEQAVGAVALDGVDVDADRALRRAGVDGDHPVGAEHRLRAGGDRPRHRGRRCRCRRLLPDPDDVAVAAAVLEVGVDGLGEVGALDEPAEVPDVLGPVRHQRGGVERSVLGQPDEGGDGGADPLDGSRSGIDLFDVNARREVGRHAASLVDHLRLL